MAKICTKCNFENADADLFCNSCGAELAAAAAVAAPKPKKVVKKQKQNPAIRTLLIAILAAAIVLCLLGAVQHTIGTRLVYNTRVLDDGSTARSINIVNSWDSLISIFKNLKAFFSNFDFSNSNTVYTIFSQLAQPANVISYLLVAVVLGIALYLVFTKHPQAGLVTIAGGVLGLVVIILGFLIGYLFIVNKISAGDQVLQYSRTLPQMTVLSLLPLFAELPLLALMLPKKEKKNKEDK